MSFFGQAFAREVTDGVAVSVSLEETVVAGNVTLLLSSFAGVRGVIPDCISQPLSRKSFVNKIANGKLPLPIMF